MKKSKETTQPASQNNKVFVAFLVISTVILLATYKFFLKSKKPHWTKILLFFNSLIINDLSLR